MSAPAATNSDGDLKNAVRPGAIHSAPPRQSLIAHRSRGSSETEWILHDTLWKPPTTRLKLFFANATTRLLLAGVRRPRHHPIREVSIYHGLRPVDRLGRTHVRRGRRRGFQRLAQVLLVDRQRLFKRVRRRNHQVRRATCGKTIVVQEERQRINQALGDGRSRREDNLQQAAPARWIPDSAGM